MKLEYSKIDNLVILGKGVDAYIGEADYDGVEMTVEQLNSIPDDWQQELIYDHYNPK